MISTTMQNAFSEQIKNEFYSAYLYLGMAAYCESSNLPGSARWLKLQAQEELEHGMKMFEFVNECGGKVTLHAIDKPDVEYPSLLKVFEETLAHEQKVTSLIKYLYSLALKENDYASQIFLQWFITEQVEEEAHAGHVVETLRMVGSHGNGIVMLDRELGRRSGE